MTLFILSSNYIENTDSLIEYIEIDTDVNIIYNRKVSLVEDYDTYYYSEIHNNFKLDKLLENKVFYLSKNSIISDINNIVELQENDIKLLIINNERSFNLTSINLNINKKIILNIINKKFNNINNNIVNNTDITFSKLKHVFSFESSNSNIKLSKYYGLINKDHNSISIYPNLYFFKIKYLNNKFNLNIPKYNQFNINNIKIFEIPVDNERINDIVYDIDKNIIYTCTNLKIYRQFYNFDNNIIRFDDINIIYQSFDVKDSIHSIKLSNNGKYLVLSYFNNNTIGIFNIKSRQTYILCGAYDSPGNSYKFDTINNMFINNINGPTDIVIKNNNNILFIDSLNGSIKEININYKNIKLITGFNIYTLNDNDPVRIFWMNRYIDYFEHQDNDNSDNVRFNKPNKMVITKNNDILYVADTYNNCIRKVYLTGNNIGKTETIVGKFDIINDLPLNNDILDGKDVRLYYPMSIILSNDQKYLFICDTENNCIKYVDLLSISYKTYRLVNDKLLKLNKPYLLNLNNKGFITVVDLNNIIIIYFNEKSNKFESNPINKISLKNFINTQNNNKLIMYKYIHNINSSTTHKIISNNLNNINLDNINNIKITIDDRYILLYQKSFITTYIFDIKIYIVDTFNNTIESILDNTYIIFSGKTKLNLEEFLFPNKRITNLKKYEVDILNSKPNTTNDILKKTIISNYIDIYDNTKFLMFNNLVNIRLLHVNLFIINNSIFENFKIKNTKFKYTKYIGEIYIFSLYMIEVLELNIRRKYLIPIISSKKNKFIKLFDIIKQKDNNRIIYNVGSIYSDYINDIDIDINEFNVIDDESYDKIMDNVDSYQFNSEIRCDISSLDTSKYLFFEISLFIFTNKSLYVHSTFKFIINELNFIELYKYNEISMHLTIYNNKNDCRIINSINNETTSIDYKFKKDFLSIIFTEKYVIINTLKSTDNLHIWDFEHIYMSDYELSLIRDYTYKYKSFGYNTNNELTINHNSNIYYRFFDNISFFTLIIHTFTKNNILNIAMGTFDDEAEIILYSYEDEHNTNVLYFDWKFFKILPCTFLVIRFKDPTINNVVSIELSYSISGFQINDTGNIILSSDYNFLPNRFNYISYILDSTYINNIMSNSTFESKFYNLNYYTFVKLEIKESKISTFKLIILDDSTFDKIKYYEKEINNLNIDDNFNTDVKITSIEKDRYKISIINIKYNNNIYSLEYIHFYLEQTDLIELPTIAFNRSKFTILISQNDTDDYINKYYVYDFFTKRYISFEPDITDITRSLFITDQEAIINNINEIISQKNTITSLEHVIKNINLNIIHNNFKDNIIDMKIRNDESELFILNNNILFSLSLDDELILDKKQDTIYFKNSNTFNIIIDINEVILYIDKKLFQKFFINNDDDFLDFENIKIKYYYNDYINYYYSKYFIYHKNINIILINDKIYKANIISDYYYIDTLTDFITQDIDNITIIKYTELIPPPKDESLSELLFENMSIQNIYEFIDKNFDTLNKNNVIKINIIYDEIIGWNNQHEFQNQNNSDNGKNGLDLIIIDIDKFISIYKNLQLINFYFKNVTLIARDGEGAYGKSITDTIFNVGIGSQLIKFTQNLTHRKILYIDLIFDECILQNSKDGSIGINYSIEYYNSDYYTWPTIFDYMTVLRPGVVHVYDIDNDNEQILLFHSNTLIIFKYFRGTYTDRSIEFIKDHPRYLYLVMIDGAKFDEPDEIRNEINKFNLNIDTYRDRALKYNNIPSYVTINSPVYRKDFNVDIMHRILSIVFNIYDDIINIDRFDDIFDDIINIDTYDNITILGNNIANIHGHNYSATVFEGQIIRVHTYNYSITVIPEKITESTRGITGDGNPNLLINYNLFNENNFILDIQSQNHVLKNNQVELNIKIINSTMPDGNGAGTIINNNVDNITIRKRLINYYDVNI